MVEHLGVINRLVVNAAVGNRRISRRQLQVGDTVRDTAEGGRLLDVGIAVFIHFDQGGKSKIYQVVIACPRANRRQRLQRDDVDGVRNRPSYGGRSDVPAVPVLGSIPIRVSKWFVIVNRVRQCVAAAVNGRGEGGKHLEARSRLARVGRRAVKG